ncbi:MULTISPECIES: LD-carboxypeptidase [unclassified Polaribacter]|uniref:S66 peptidase family protein n=1 Tax=unclassified Polaribacter TaxID=196858 RepID=UPI0011BD5BFD|nr:MULTISPECIES: LD-carboxypeptidase [unclassified Polaribacter]TXD53511.1 LD-carboxypeptidase [Polaribacter sp. IC063]TXD58341.1 LD-carboxypeptidase [Polaribacter sp. IC066]
MKSKIVSFLLLMSFTFTNAQQKLTTPPYLKIGDTIAIVAPAGILKGRQATIQKAKKLAESWGLKVVLGKNMYNQNNHFAGTDDERCQDFQEALDNKNIKAIWAARGGYGSVRILDKLDFAEFKRHPKWVIGYSDITAFHNHIYNLGVETIHGMMATSLEQKPEEIMNTISSFKKSLFGEALSYTVASSKYNRTFSSKEIEGQLIGGNLSILTSMLGSESELNTENKILFIEEIGEYKYSIDRMLQSLKRAGYFTNVNAVIVGNISLVKKNSTQWGSSIEQLILDVVPAEVPVLFNFPAGHEADNRALIFGRNVDVKIGDAAYSINFKEN